MQPSLTLRGPNCLSSLLQSRAILERARFTFSSTRTCHLAVRAPGWCNQPFCRICGLHFLAAIAVQKKGQERCKIVTSHTEMRLHKLHTLHTDKGHEMHMI